MKVSYEKLRILMVKKQMKRTDLMRAAEISGTIWEEKQICQIRITIQN